MYQIYPVIVGQNAFIYDVHYNEKYNSDLAGFCNDNHINLMVNANRNDTPFVQAVFGMDDKAYRLLSFMDKCSAEEEEQTTSVGWDHSDEDYAWIVTGEDSDDEADDSFGLTGDEKVAGEYRDFEFPSL